VKMIWILMMTMHDEVKMMQQALHFALQDG